MSHPGQFPKKPRLSVKAVTKNRVVKHTVYVGNSVQEDDVAPAVTEEVVEPPPVSNEQEFECVHDTSAASSAKPKDEWVSIRKQLIHTYSQRNIRDHNICVVCASNINPTNHIKCCDCSSHGYYCSPKCCVRNHSSICNAFHKPMIWQIDTHQYTEFYVDIRLYRPEHRCSTQKTRNGVQVFDRNGREHLIQVEVCKCEEQTVTFLRHGIWPATTNQPNTAYDIELLNVIKYMMLEGKSSLLAICQAMRFANNLTVKQGETLYNRLRGKPFQEYMYFSYQIQSLQLTCKIQDGAHCLACPQQNGQVFLSMDANFGLVHKKSAGTSKVDNLHGLRMFAEQSEDNVSVDKDTLQECSNFQAGKVLRSNNVLNKLDVTGVFGSACRHEVPKTFLDMTRGESLDYPIALAKHIMEEVNGRNLTINLLYDIGCKLDKRLQSTGDPMYGSLSIAVPVFHAYGHKPSCQVKYSARWREGFALTDGEAMERLWAYLRRFGFITKEMTTANRKDFLTNALLHYAMKKNSAIDYTLCKNLARADRVSNEVDNELAEYCLNLSLSYANVNEIFEEEKQRFNAPSSIADYHQLSGTEKYVQLLASKADIENKMVIGCSDVISANGDQQEKIGRLNQELKRIEKTLKINQRWTTSTPAYDESKKSLQLKQKKKMIFKMYDSAIEYEFVQTLKGKYGDRNQKMAGRVQKQVIRIAGNMRRMVAQYNAAQFNDNIGNLPDRLDFNDIKKANCDLYKQLHGLDETLVGFGANTLSRRMLHEVAQLRSRQLRVKEEKALIKQEMLNVLDNLAKHYMALNQQIEDGLEPGLYVDAMSNLLQLRSHYIRARNMFTPHLPALPEQPSILSGPVVPSIINELDNTPSMFDSESSDDESSASDDDDDDDHHHHHHHLISM